MRKIGILGGTFNPPHIGHLIMADGVCDAYGLDEVRLMPTAIPPHKQLADTASPEQRLKMTALATEGNSRLSVCDEEVAAGGVSYTVLTMERLIAKEPDAEFYFIIGGDMIDSLHTWRGIDRLLTMVRFIGVRRPDTAGHTELPISLADVPLIDISSTALRNRYCSQMTTSYLTPAAVDRYIRKERLYGS